MVNGLGYLFFITQDFMFNILIILKIYFCCDCSNNQKYGLFVSWLFDPKISLTHPFSIFFFQISF